MAVSLGANDGPAAGDTGLGRVWKSGVLLRIAVRAVIGELEVCSVMEVAESVRSANWRNAQSWASLEIAGETIGCLRWFLGAGISGSAFPETSNARK